MPKKNSDVHTSCSLVNDQKINSSFFFPLYLARGKQTSVSRLLKLSIETSLKITLKVIELCKRLTSILDWFKKIVLKYYFTLNLH